MRSREEGGGGGGGGTRRTLENRLVLPLASGPARRTVLAPVRRALRATLCAERVRGEKRAMRRKTRRTANEAKRRVGERVEGPKTGMASGVGCAAAMLAAVWDEEESEKAASSSWSRPHRPPPPPTLGLSLAGHALRFEHAPKAQLHSAQRPAPRCSLPLASSSIRSATGGYGLSAAHQGTRRLHRRAPLISLCSPQLHDHAPRVAAARVRRSSPRARLPSAGEALKGHRGASCSPHLVD